MGVAIGNRAKVIYLGVIPSPLDLFTLYVHHILPHGSWSIRIRKLASVERAFLTPSAPSRRDKTRY